MTEKIDELTAWVTDHRALAITAAAALVALIVSLAIARIVAGYRGRSLSAKASAGFAVVQAGVAYVTITGVYELWAHKVGVPTWDAAGIAVFIEAVTWAAVAMIFDHGHRPGTTGFGDAGPLFWLSIVGGGLMAVAGSDTLRVALARAVVVVLGAAMWHLRIRQRTRRSTAPTRWVNPLRQMLLSTGLMIPGDGDVTHTSREWQVRSLTRAVRRSNARQPWKWIGGRTIQRVMESGDADMVREAQQRYALQHVLRTEIDPESESMAAAIAAARVALNPPEPVADAPPAPEPPPVPVPVPDSAGQRRTARRPGVRGEALRERAENDALLALQNGEALTGREFGQRYKQGEEWGRLRIRAARTRLNGHDPATSGKNLA